LTQTFEELGLNADLLKTLERLSYHEPTPIQQQAIPALLAGEDVLGQAQTGTGKTAAFTLPILNRIDKDGLQTLILTPTRELAQQVSEAVYRYGSHMGIKVLPIYGGSSYDRQIRRLKKGVHVVVGTPGRTLDLIKKRVLDLSGIRFMVFDEADEMLKMGFIEDVEAILSATPKETRQTLLFSATFSREILRLAQQYMRDPIHIEVEAEQVTADNIEQRYYLVNERDKVAALSRILETETRQNTLVFTRTRIGSAELAETLIERGYPAVAIHGDLAQNERERILRRFRDGQLSILVATDVVGRGMDVSDVSHVVNFDIPQLPIEYVHRIGRTGRAGRSGVALTLITPKQRHTMRRIEQFIETRITKTKLPSIEQVKHARDQIFRAELMQHLSTEEFNDADYDLIDSLLTEGFSAEQIVSGMLKMLRKQSTDYPLENIADVFDKPARNKGRSKGRSNGYAGSNGASNGRGNKGGRRKYNDSNMVSVMFNVGRNSGVKPGDVVHTVASTSNIPGSVIGAITIKNEKTFVDVPADHVKRVLENAGRGKIRGKRVSVSLA